MRVATWNVNSLRVRLPQLEQWVAQARPDVLCLQETKCEDEHYPLEELAALGYPHQCHRGEKTYNGVAILSKLPLEDVRFGFTEGAADPQCRLMQATIGGIRFLDCYVPNGNPVGSSKFTYKLAWMSRLKQEVRALRGRPVVVAGDMNITLDDADVWDPFGADEQLMCTTAERDALRRLLREGLVDTWRAAYPHGTEFTWWDYRQGGFQRNHGYRIDYVFASPDLAERVTDVRIWQEPRTWKLPSDHAPITLDLG